MVNLLASTMPKISHVKYSVVVTTLDFQAGRPGFKPWSDLYSRS